MNPPARQRSPALRARLGATSGQAAISFALMSIGLFGSPAQRGLWCLTGALAGLMVGAGRVAQGGHFGSDVLFAGLFVWISHALLREAWLRLVLQRRRAHGRPLARRARGPRHDTC